MAYGNKLSIFIKEFMSYKNYLTLFICFHLAHSAKLTALKQLLTDLGFGVGGAADTGDTFGGLLAAAPVVSQHRALVFFQQKSMLDTVENDLLKVTWNISFTEEKTFITS